MKNDSTNFSKKVLLLGAALVIGYSIPSIGSGPIGPAAPSIRSASPAVPINKKLFVCDAPSTIQKNVVLEPAFVKAYDAETAKALYKRWCTKHLEHDSDKHHVNCEQPGCKISPRSDAQLSENQNYGLTLLE